MTQQPSRYSFTWLGEPRNVKVEVGQATISSSEAAEPPGRGIKATASELMLRGDHELQAGTKTADDTPAGTGVMGTTDAEDGPVVSEVHLALQTEQPASGASPGHRSFSARGVVLPRGGDRVVSPTGDGVLVVLDGVGSHHSHPRHAQHLLAN